uniref:Amine oxidase domain-containing protein n=1 Tax=Oryza punctata TaxID=4537 RepID=A0A0E0ML69_ORYPU
MRVAVVGAGVSGLAAAHELATSCAGGVDVTVYEKEDCIGGSLARTVAVDDGGAGGGLVHLHLGFMPFNSAAPPTRGPSSFRHETSSAGGDAAVLPLRSMGPAACFRWKGSDVAAADPHLPSGERDGASSCVREPEGRDRGECATVLTCPNMMQWFEDLGANMERSDMSFSVRTQLDVGGECEWASSNGISGLLAQRSNALSPSFWRMISEILKFKSDALRYLEDCENNPDLDQSETLGQFVQSHGYSQFFQEAYLFPICGWMWSCPSQRVLGFSASFVLSFFLVWSHQSLIVNGCSQSYFNKVRKDLESRSCRIRTNCHVKCISSFDRGYSILKVDGSEEMYDRIIIGIHAPDALKLLGAEATHEESRILGAFQYVSRTLNLPGLFSSHRIPLMFLIMCCLSGIQIFLFRLAASKASLELDQIQGKRGSGFHEDGFKIDPLTNPKQMVLSWTETGARLLVLRFLKQYISVGNLMKNTVIQTRQNVSQHYDLSNDFFSLFLDKSMTYSSAIFKDEEEGLEEAQLRKINLPIHKAKVGRDDEVLEIGSGWGSLAMEVMKQTGCKYTGVTQSVEQLKYAQRRVKEAGLEDRITFLLCDYREIPCHKYDRIICCEMIEEVGHEYMDEFFGCCESLLAEDGIFVIQHVENIGHHYYRTLIHWRDNFMANKDKILALGFDEKFIRTWEYYFIYCAADCILSSWEHQVGIWLLNSKLTSSVLVREGTYLSLSLCNNLQETLVFMYVVE